MCALMLVLVNVNGKVQILLLVVLQVTTITSYQDASTQ